MPPPRNSDHRSPKRQRFPPPPPRFPEEEEEEENDYTDDIADDDDEEDHTDESADDDEEEEEEQQQQQRRNGLVPVESIAIEIGGPDLVVRGKEDQFSPSYSSSSSSQLSVKLNSFELDCPTCLDPLRGPIYQCRNGHITCSACLPKVYWQCPVCEISIGDIRCRAMERVIESSTVPCCNAAYGCKQTSSYGSVSDHEKECAYARCVCPLPHCSYAAAYKDLQTHARDLHSWDVESLTPFVFDLPQVFSMNLVDKKTAVFQEVEEGDLIVIQAFEGTTTRGGVCVTVSRIAPLTPGLRDLSCSLAKINVYSTLKLGVMVKKIQKVEEPVEEPKKNFLFIPEYMLSDDDDQFRMEICVGNEFEYILI